MAIYPEQVLDLPNLKEFMATTFFELIDKGSVDIVKITFAPPNPSKGEGEDEDSMVMVEDYFILMAHILSHYYDKERDWMDVKKFYEKSKFKD
jgi:hypothetical protein